MLINEFYTRSERNLSNCNNLYCYCLIIFVSAVSPLSLADISFEEVTHEAGIHYVGPTAGASWGDLDGDGWPDIWVGNHKGLMETNIPNLYLNQRDGTFIDVSKSVLSPTSPDADFHGGAWADFDNDGDQDLIVLAGGGGGLGSSPNYFFLNREGTLRNEAASLNLDYPLGRGRTPLWFDADGDGRLDVLVMNRPRKHGRRVPSTVFRQTMSGFEASNDKFDFRYAARNKLEKIGDLISNLLRFRLRKGPPIVTVSYEFAQLGYVSDNSALNLIAYGKPTRIYSLNNTSFEDISNKFRFGNAKGVWDAALEDFNGDGQFDIYFVRAKGGQDAVLVDSYELRGSFRAAERENDVAAVRFRSDGKMTFQHYTPNEDPTDPWGSSTRVFIGSEEARPITIPFSLSPDDPWVRGPVSTAAFNTKGIWIEYDSGPHSWKLSSTVKRLNFIIRMTEPIQEVETIGFDPSIGARADKLLVNHDGELLEQALQGDSGSPNACRSVAAGDYDNDMDVDLYLVCSGAVQNLPNRLLENDGQGNFKVVNSAGGAAGSKFGQGDVVATADYDRDGFLDLFVTNGSGSPPFANDGPHQLFRNRGNKNHWLEIDLEGTVSNRDGIGSLVVLEVGGIVQVRAQSGGMHSFAQNHQRVHFGLAQHTRVDRITVHWPSGKSQQLQNVNADQILLIKEPTNASP